VQAIGCSCDSDTKRDEAVVDAAAGEDEEDGEGDEDAAAGKDEDGEDGVAVVNVTLSLTPAGSGASQGRSAPAVTTGAHPH